MPPWGQTELPGEFGPFPDAARWARGLGREDAAALAWFLGRQDGPELAVCANGTLHRRGYAPVSLLETYRAEASSLTTLLAATAADLLG